MDLRSLIAALLITIAGAFAQTEAVRKGAGHRITEDLNFHTGRTFTIESGGTITISGAFSATPTGGTIDFGNVTITLPAGAVGSAQITDASIVNADLSASAAIALSKLATDPLARANHTGTQTLSTISDAGSLAALSAIASAQITDDTIVNADINASAAIALSKLATDPLARANHTGTQTLSTISDAGTLAGLSAVGSAQITDASIVNADLSASAAIALSKLATDPLARANHTGTQTLSTISDAGSLAALSAIASAQITDDTIVNADINASAAIALSKLATDPLARANHTGTQTLSTISDAGTLAGLSAIASAQITDGTIVNADINGSAAIASSKLLGDDTAYNATTWNGATAPPSMNAVRDKFESLSVGVSDGDKGDITASSSGTVWTIDNGVVTAAKTSITGTPTGAKFLRDDWSWQDAGGVGTEYVKLLSGAGGSALVDTDPFVDTPGFEGQLGLAWNGNDDASLVFAGSTSAGDWNGAISFPGGIKEIGHVGYASPGFDQLEVNINGNPAQWDVAGEGLFHVANHSGDTLSSGSGYNVGVMQAGYGVTALAIDDDGTGYAVDDLLTVSGGTTYAAAHPAVLRVTGVSSGNITSAIVHIVGEYLTLPSNPVSVTGGTGSGATFNLTTATKNVRALADNSLSFMHVPANRDATLIPGWGEFVMNGDATHNKGFAFCSPALSGLGAGNYSWMMLEHSTGLVRFPKWVADKHQPSDAGWLDTMTINPGNGVVRVMGSLVQRNAANNADVITTNTSGDLAVTGIMNVNESMRSTNGSGLWLNFYGSNGGTFDFFSDNGGTEMAQLTKNTGLVLPLSGQVIELGAVSDTTLSRVSAGVLAVEGVNVATISGTQTLTNKTISGASNTITNVSLTAGVTGTLPVANGGTGATALPAYASASYATYTQDSTNIPFDNTIAQNTEGTEILTVTITPTKATSKLRIHVSGSFTKATSATGLTVAVFVDSTADAIEQRYGMNVAAANGTDAISFDFDVDASSTSSRTYKVRFGAGSGNSWVNGNQSTRIGGGATTARLIVEEKFQ